MKIKYDFWDRGYSFWGMFDKQGEKKVESIYDATIKKNFCCPKKYFQYAMKRLEKLASNKRYSEAMDSQVRNILLGCIERELKRQNKIELTDFSSDYV